MVDCRTFSDRRFKCHSVYGKGGEECLHEELSEKRCVSLHHCPRQAHDYYGAAEMDSMANHQLDGISPAFLSNKALCASWAEAFAYAEKELEFGQDVASHHRNARSIVTQDPKLKRECRDMAFALAKCLRYKKLF